MVKPVTEDRRQGKVRQGWGLATLPGVAEVPLHFSLC